MIWVVVHSILHSGDAIINASHRNMICELVVDRKWRKGMILFMAKIIHFQQVKPEMCYCLSVKFSQLWDSVSKGNRVARGRSLTTFQLQNFAAKYSALYTATLQTMKLSDGLCCLTLIILTSSVATGPAWASSKGLLSVLPSFSAPLSPLRKTSSHNLTP